MTSPILPSSKVGSFKNAVAVSPSDSAANIFRAIYVGGAGSVALVPAGGGSAVTFVGLATGQILAVACSLVKATGTTATGLVRLS
jgi:hypothetical protein